MNEILLLFIGWFIQASFELSCIQCTSPIRRNALNRNHSCLYGTLEPLPCSSSNNDSNYSFKTCTSSVYRIGFSRNGGNKTFL
ncbi:unnamed protein product [Rotaria magnacalcarata]|uniref:Secreted protein n=2 Tax=Rotaria magnacalcarata TaxID=392030 RepID=A0A815NDE2_9BILA|nr:unnamed protein product [Rotaria magnacalcarata]CAF1646703.1 unnamed protein product [Rotaria magnacalcarata]CAF2149034.1 unnamed protein product [Rotaria magnacalcarata]